MKRSWDQWVEEAIFKLESMNLIFSLKPIYLSNQQTKSKEDEYVVFDEMQQQDRSAVEFSIVESTFHKWLHNVHSTGHEIVSRDEEADDGKIDTSFPLPFKKLLLFSGNDYLALTSHPTVRKAAAEAAQEHGMGPRGSPLICGYTNYHSLLESSLANLKKKEDCLLCSTGFSANMAMMVTLGSIASVLAADGKPLKDEKVAIFSDALNHASIIDGIRLANTRRNMELFMYRHCDMTHLDALLSGCKLEKKVVVTDSLFSLDGDIAPMVELAELRKKHGFLFIVDDAHGTFLFGKNGGGVAEEFNCEKDVDISIGTLSKAAGCLGGFIACSKRWKQLIQSRGRAFIFTTALPVPIAASAHAAVIVAQRESWRRKALWDRVQDFQAITGIPVRSPIISLVVGSGEKALQASRHLLKSGFHVMAVTPPAVAQNTSRLRIAMNAAHTTDDVEKLITALSSCIDFKEISRQSSILHAKL